MGCAVNCQFCLTAKLGVNATSPPAKSSDRCWFLARSAGRSGSERINLVFMGMGEPFLNYDNFMKAVRLLVQEVGIPESRMTVSTAGIVPRIEEFGREPIRPKLAISLNASNDEVRASVMPLNRKWDLEKLLAAARAFPLRNRERLTFEYVLLDGVNDSAENAREVVRLLNGIRAKVNLIALNPGPDIPYRTPSKDRLRVSADSFERRCASLYPSPARPRHLRRLRAVEEDGGTGHDREIVLGWPTHPCSLDVWDLFWMCETKRSPITPSTSTCSCFLPENRAGSRLDPAGGSIVRSRA